ncbi:MAG TPA: cytochrome c [Candidatus Xenobia bacterium]|nr:cytochrome c [Candidatus Xenobia bacterium]
MSNRVRILVLVLVVAGLVAAPAFSAGKADAGKAVYDKKCASCHAKDGAGNPGIAKAMKVELRHLGSKEVQAKSDADLKKDIVEGTGKMKAVKLTDAEAADVIAFVRTLKK